MYEEFYQLREEPFRLSPDHRFCFEHKGYVKARAYMAYAFKRAEGFVMITGQPGTGKTTLIGHLIESLAQDSVTTANLVCTQLQADDLLKTVAYSFGVGSISGDKADILQRITILLQTWNREGRRALLIVDEAQDLSSSAMEELRLLTNIQVRGKPLLQIFLLGQPELRDLILSPQLEQVHQRIIAASHLQSLEEFETESYIRHRLEKAGWRGQPAISRAIYPLIYRYSEGVPRRINLICSRLFLYGAVEQLQQLGVADLREVIGELQMENLAVLSEIREQEFAVADEYDPVPVVEEAEADKVEAVKVEAENVEAEEIEADSVAAAESVDALDKASSWESPEVVKLHSVTTIQPDAEIAESELAPRDAGLSPVEVPAAELALEAEPGLGEKKKPAAFFLDGLEGSPAVANPIVWEPRESRSSPLAQSSYSRRSRLGAGLVALLLLLVILTWLLTHPDLGLYGERWRNLSAWPNSESPAVNGDESPQLLGRKS